MEVLRCWSKLIILLLSRVNRLKYLDEYSCTLKIIKTEPDSVSSNGRTPVVYLLEKCYPYSIDTVPLAYGSSQVARLTVNFLLF